MQDASPPKRSVGRPRLSNAHTQVRAQTRAPSSIALNVALTNIASSNQTTNHFLGSGIIQRPWMKTNASVPAREPPVISPSTADVSSTSTARHPSSPSAAVSNSVLGIGRGRSPASVERPVPAYHFIPSPPSTSAAVRDVQTEAATNMPDGSCADTQVYNHAQETDNLQNAEASQCQVHVMDLTMVEDEVTNHVRYPPTSAPHFDQVSSAQPNVFPQLPTLEMNEDFDLMTTDKPRGSIADQNRERLQAKEPLPAPMSSETPHDTSVAQQSASQRLSMDPIGPQISHDLSNLNRTTTQPSRTTALLRSIPDGRRSTTSNQHHTVHRNLSASITTMHGTVGVPPRPNPQRSTAQLLTPEQSPLNTTHQPLPQKRPSSEIQTSRPPPTLPARPAHWSQPSPLSVPQPRRLSSDHRPQNTLECGNGVSGVGFDAQHPAPTNHRGLSHLATINSTVEDMSRRINLACTTWNLRLPWLQEACQRGDLFFLQLNQIFCMRTIHTEVVRSLGLDRTCDSGFAVLERLLGKNTDLHPELLAFLAGWPNSTYSLEFNRELKVATTEIARFLPILGTRWSSFRQGCVRRKVPPMTAEIFHYLCCPLSIVLPSAMFCSMQRQILPTGSAAISSDAYALFRDNMRGVHSSHPNSGNFPIFHELYKNIYVRHLNNPGLSETQIAELRTILYQLSLTGPQAQHVDPAPRQVHNHAAQGSLHPVQFNRSLRETTSNAHVRQPTLNISTRALLSPPSRTSVNNQTAAINSLGSATPRLPAAPGSNRESRAETGTDQTELARRHSAVAPNRDLGYSSTSNSRAQRTSPTNSFPLNIGHAPSIHESLLPVDVEHLPAFLVNPNPIQEALHQVHLRQPAAAVEGAKSNKPPRLFQYIQDLVYQPKSWLPSSGFVVVSFDIATDLLRRRPKIIANTTDPFDLPKRMISAESILFNLRCVKLNGLENTTDINSSWAALSTYWPKHIFISINGTHLDIRRKRHHGRDLPIDVTSHVKEGQNEVKISIHPEQNERDITHGLAVEVIAFHNYEELLTLPTEIEAKASLEALVSAMSTQKDIKDDDVVLVDDNMTISVTDPFSSRIFTIPVRGKSCKHRECFDLETFLRSRQSDFDDALTSVYAWQCPFCRADARPSSLVIDRFFQNVRNDLVNSDQSDVRAIIVKADGSWEPKMEAQEIRSVHRNTSKPRSRSNSASHRPTVEKRHSVGMPINPGNTPHTAIPNSELTTSTAPSRETRSTEIIELD